jgi:hypothetical protein
MLLVYVELHKQEWILLLQLRKDAAEKFDWFSYRQSLHHKSELILLWILEVISFVLILFL